MKDFSRVSSIYGRVVLQERTLSSKNVFPSISKHTLANIFLIILDINIVNWQSALLITLFLPAY